MCTAGIGVCSLQEPPVRGSNFNSFVGKVTVKTIPHLPAGPELGGIAGCGKIPNVVQMESRLCDQGPSYHPAVTGSGRPRADGKNDRSILKFLDPDGREALVVGSK